MNIKKIIMVGLVAAASLALGEVAVTGVTAKQRYPWNGLVDITVTLSGTEEECTAATFPFYVTNKTTRAELPVRIVTANGAVTGEGNRWTRKLIWNAIVDVGCAKFGEVELTVGAPVTGGVQLWENGPYWAECNVGASQPEECGYYFWWGDTVGYKRNANNDGWISVKDGSSFSFSEGNCSTYGKNESQLQSEGYIDATGNLVAAHDAATAHLGSSWRMPTEEDFSALINNCDTELTKRNGVDGKLIKGRGSYSSNSIFLPIVGCGIGSLYSGGVGRYWSSTLSLTLYFLNFIQLAGLDSDWGAVVRPVRGFAQ